MVMAKNVKVGDLVDLEGDEYADPDYDKTWMLYLFAEVTDVEQETPECVAIGFEGFDLVGFPTDHELRVMDR